MMRRSKRQTKCNNSKSIDETDQVEQQQQQSQPAQTKLILKKSKKLSQQNYHEETQNNFQITSTKRELDSVVVNLASQLEKASNAQDAAESGRPKRVRKITEKAEQELLAKQIKAKAHQKKLNDGKSSHSENHSEPLKSLNPNYNHANNKSANTRSRRSELLNDEHDMDIENIRISDQKTENTLQFCQQMNKHSLQQSDVEEDQVSDAENSQENDSQMDEEHQVEEVEYDDDDEEQDEEEENGEDEEEEQEDADDDCEGSENEENEQGIEEEDEDDNQADDNEEKLLTKESNLPQEENILKASTKSNQQQQGDSNNQNKLNSKESNKIVKKRSSSVDKSNKNLNFDSQNNNTNNNKSVDTVNNKVKDESDTENQSELTKKQQQPQQLGSESNTSVPPIPLLKKKQSKKQKKQDLEENTSEEKQQDEQEEKQLQENEEEDGDEEDESSSADDDEDNKNEEGGKGDGSNSSKAKKMPWSEEEDKLVIRLVEQHGPQKWTFIAQHIPGRIGKQCRERWHNHLNPKINKEPWGDDEEWVLFLCHKLKGNKWAEITQYLPGRTDNAIKNHWNSSMKKRIPELYQRFAYIKRGESPEYEITSQYKKFEDEILKQLLAMADEGVDQYFVQTTRRRRNNNAISSTPTNNNVSVKGSKFKRVNESNEEKNDEEEQELTQVPLTKKVSKAALKAAAKQAALAEKQQQQLNEDNLNNHFTPINNNKSSNNNFKNIPNSAAASTADVKEIIQRIPHNIKEFENFRKQIIQYSDEYYQNHHLLQQTPNDKESSLNLLSADKGMNTDVNLSDTKHLEKILETPLSVENYVQQNPIFADIVRSALKYSSCQKNLTFMSHVKKSNSNVLEASVNNDHNQLSATSTLLNTVQQDKSSLPNLDQSPDDDILSSTKNGNEKLKKKRGRKPKSVKEPEINQHVPINASNPPKNINAQNPNGIKKIMHGPPYMHPMYMMNPHHPHPYYANHPHHPGYYPPPPPHMIAHMQGYPHPHHMQHPIPPPHMQHPHYRQMGHHHPPPPPPHHQGMRGSSNGQGHMMMPPPPPHHLQQMRMRHPGMGHPHHMYMGSNMMSQHSDSSENSNFQTPQKYQKTNQGDRSIFKSVTPIIPPNSEKQIKFEEKQNKQIKLNNFNNDDDYNNFMANNSFSKENINPNIQNLALPSNKESNATLGATNAGNNLNSTTSNSSGNSQSSCSSNNNNNNNNNTNSHNNNNSSNNNIIIQSQNHNFITPNKYETPSKLLDFDSEPRLNCNSVDKYFNMRNFSSNHKLNNLYTNHHVNNFQHSSNSAFKCYPHINMDYQDTPSAKKSSYC